MKIELFPPLFIHELGQRDNQEDALWPDLPEEATAENRLYILCDGMGGQEHGEVASGLVSQTIPHVLRRSMSFEDDSLSDEDLLACLERAYQELDREAGNSSRQMGTTITLIYIGKNGVTSLHMGDSRIYHIRPNVGILYQSRDHSLATELYQAGEITYEEMLHYPKKNIVTRAMMPGKDNRMHPDVIHITDIFPGDYFYMCSDGMLEQMSNDQLLAVLSSGTTDKDKQDQLIEATINNQDNHTAWIIHIKSVVKEEKDWEIPNEELTAKCNMALNYPSMENKNSDVTIVKKSAYSPLGFIKRIFNV